LGFSGGLGPDGVMFDAGQLLCTRASGLLFATACKICL
jgi:hypothetical protein